MYPEELINATAPSSPAAAPPVPARNPAPPQTPNGGSSSTTSIAAASRPMHRISTGSAPAFIPSSRLTIARQITTGYRTATTALRITSRRAIRRLRRYQSAGRKCNPIDGSPNGRPTIGYLWVPTPARGCPTRHIERSSLRSGQLTRRRYRRVTAEAKRLRCRKYGPTDPMIRATPSVLLVGSRKK